MQIYALCDEDLLNSKGVGLEEFVKLAIKKDAKIIQYRNKNGDINYIKSQLIKLRKLYDGFLIINDHISLAPLCDGVHIGQDDLVKISEDKKSAIKILKTTIGEDKIIGLSTHGESEILEANELELNYIGLGAFKNTNTKNDVSSILGEKLDALALLSKHPVVAIGGIKFSDKFENVKYVAIGSAFFG